MATLKDIRLRMSSIRNTQQITKAMKMVSASKMKRAEKRIKEARPFAKKMRQMATHLASGMQDDSHELLATRKGGKAVILLVTSDKGLCGGLNSNLCKMVNQFAFKDAEEFDETDLIILGKKGNEFFKHQQAPISESHLELKENQMPETIETLILRLIKEFKEHRYNHLFLSYNHFKNVITHQPKIERLLPVIAKEEDESPSLEKTDTLFEPGQQEILDSFLPQYLINQAQTAYFDNLACEHAARMTSMDAATNNATEMLQSLQLLYNRARQASITKELIEIISGAESL